MSAVKFSATEEKVPATPAEPSPAPSNTTTALAPRTTSLAVGDYVPTLTEIRLPRIAIAHPIGNLGRVHPHGAIVFGNVLPIFTPTVLDQNQQVVAAGTKPLVVTVVGFESVRFAEKTVGGARGLIVNTEAEVEQNGGTLIYNDWKAKQASGIKLFQKLATLLVAIERPEQIPDDETVFIFPINGKKYAIAKWLLKGPAYTEALTNVLLPQRQIGCCREVLGGYPGHSFYLSTALKNKAGNMVWCPVLLPAAKSTPEFAEFVKLVKAGQIAPQEATDEAAQEVD
jgi:hypothetical protein